MKTKKALLIVDVQNDFCPRGALAVPQGDEVVPVLNDYINLFQKKGWPIFASRDWHPSKTKHFKNFGGLWPIHCVQNTNGAKFHPNLELPRDTIVLSKGMDPQTDSYSAFQGLDDKGRPFLEILQAKGIAALYVGGLATDYCVKSSVLDARKNKFKVCLLMDAIRGVNLHPDDSHKATEEMVHQGAKKFNLEKLAV